MQNLLLECAVRAALMAVCTAAVLYVLQVKAARVRHAVWASVVVLMLALPVWTAWGPRAVVRPPGQGQRAARARGLRCDDGLGMLARQGALALELWLGVPAPLAEMRAALE